VVAALAAALVCPTPVMFRIAAARITSLWNRPLVVGLRPAMHRLVHDLRAKTDPSARILFEDQLRLLEETDPESVHWTPLLPFLLRPDARQFVGGLYQTAFIAHHRAAAFGDFHLGDRYIDEWRPDELSAYFERYNVGWVVCWSPLSRFVFDRLPGAERIGVVSRYSTRYRPLNPDAHTWQALHARTDPATAMTYLTEGDTMYVLYRLARPHTFFLRGRGTLASVDFNRVELADVVPDAAGDAVLSLHWLDNWRTDPPLEIAPAPVPGDPVPFVRIKLGRPAGRIVLFNGYGAGRDRMTGGK